MITLLKELYRAWMSVVRAIGEVNFTIIFSVLFIVLIGPYALVSKLFRKKQPGRWIEKKYTEPTLEHLTRQF